MVATEFIVAIELGSSKISGIAGRKLPDGSIQVLATANENASGCIRKGVIYNLDKTTQSLTSIIKKLESALKASIGKVYIGMGGQSLRTIRNTEVRHLDEEIKISQELIDELKDCNRAVPIVGYEILGVAPQEYKVGNDFITEPAGVQTDHIEGRFLNIIARNNLKQNIAQCCEAANIEIADDAEDLISPLAIVDKNDEVFIIEVNPRSSRTVPFLSKSTGYSLADIATECILGKSLKEQGIFDIYPDEKKRYYVKVPVFSFNKLRGLDAYLSPEMKSTGEAIGYDDKLSRAMQKALIAGGVNLQNYGTVIVTLADEDKEEALPLVRRVYDMGFNIEATIGTANFLKAHGIRTRVRKKLLEGSEEIFDSIRAGYVSYVINTRAIMSGVHYNDGVEIRRCAVENGVTLFSSLDTVRIVLDVLEEITNKISTIDAK